ncbi:SOS response-associated peptidase [Microvirga antarctica]|uniref:SOS response-associated peptidase n=1 Tax=Microvirga antarctica TaxID=2819233 RepID=UPI001B314765|nr:SOS response-associated peptidase family protein [Microvirga antarctica]
MCNLYSLTKGQQAIRELFRVTRDLGGNLPSLPAIFPDQMAPVISNARDGERQLEMMRWGFPGPPNLSKVPVTNVRNTQSPYWRGWLKAEFRCLVPFTSFCEYEDTKPRKTPTWFALSDDRPLAAFAGIWRPWTGTRGTKAAPVEGEHRLFSFLTTEPNAEVGAIHPKAMPAVLTTQDAFETWLTGPVEDALRLQRPLHDGALAVVARGSREDP